MNSSANSIYSSRKITVYSAILSALALLILVVSCPLKQLVQENLASNSSHAVRTNQANINQNSNIDNSAQDNYCGARGNTVLVNNDLSQQVKLPAPLYFSNIIELPGFDVKYFLSRIKNNNYTTLIPSNYSSLPLFLQHLRLLI